MDSIKKKVGESATVTIKRSGKNLLIHGEVAKVRSSYGMTEYFIINGWAHEADGNGFWARRVD